MRYLSAKRRVPMMDLTEKYPDTVHPTPPPNCTTMKSVIFVLFTVLCVTPVSTYRNQTWYYKIVAKIYSRRLFSYAMERLSKEALL
uniref:Transmembrane protein n=1 Tax=Panagrellus redivivus TaxID=6233 RepID=A0A7E4W2I6_PANRE